MAVQWRGVWIVTALAALCALACATASPAAALKVKYVKASSVVDENTQEGVTANCPADMELSGGGAWAAGGYGVAGLNTTYPSADTAWTSYYDSHGGSVLFRSWAVCVDHKVQIETDEAEAFGDVNDAEARCRGRDALTGGGVFSAGTFSQTALKGILPTELTSTDPTKYYLSRVSNVSNPYVNVIPFTSYALCHKNLDVKVRESRYTTGGKGKRKVVTAHCHKGEKVLGGGGLAASLDFYVEASFPVDTKADSGKTPDNGWRAYLDNFDLYREAVVARALCV